MQLDITFSDHHLSVATLEAFGKVIQAIRQVCDDDQLRFWAFIRFVSCNHGDILSVQQSPEGQSACDEVLARADPPPVVVEKSNRPRWVRADDAHD
jgi:hypothetical protein